MRHLRLCGSQALLHLARQLPQKAVPIERLRRRKLHRAIQPAQQRLAVGINRVIHLHRFPRSLLFAGDLREPRLQIDALPR